MILSTIESIPGKKIVAHYGLVQGTTIRSKHFGRDLAATLKNFVGGELKGYTELIIEARNEALHRMEEQAKALGANGIVGIRFATSDVTTGAAEVMVYGTAVTFE